MIRTVKIEGMTCDHCAAAVKEELEKIVGLRDVMVDVSTNTANFKSSAVVTNDMITAAIAEAGYKVVQID